MRQRFAQAQSVNPGSYIRYILDDLGDSRWSVTIRISNGSVPSSDRDTDIGGLHEDVFVADRDAQHMIRSIRLQRIFDCFELAIEGIRIGIDV